MLTAKREERNGISMKTARLFLVLLVLLGFTVVLFAEEADQTGAAATTARSLK